MRLTNTIREAYIRQVLADIPAVDYTEKIRDTAMRVAIKQLPEAVRKIWEGPDRKYLQMKYISITGISMSVPGHPEQGRDSVSCDKEIEKLVDEKTKALLKVGNLRTKLSAVAYGCTTTKALAEALPEFAEYLPKDTPAPTRSLPVVTGVVSSFREAGWPKART